MIILRTKKDGEGAFDLTDHFGRGPHRFSAAFWVRASPWHTSNITSRIEDPGSSALSEFSTAVGPRRNTAKGSTGTRVRQVSHLSGR